MRMGFCSIALAILIQQGLDYILLKTDINGLLDKYYQSRNPVALLLRHPVEFEVSSGTIILGIQIRIYFIKQRSARLQEQAFQAL